MDEGQHERFLGKNEAWLSHSRPEAENFIEVPDEFSFQGSGLKTLSQPLNRQRLTFIASDLPANFTSLD